MAQPDGQGEEYKGWEELAKKNYHERGICKKKVQEVHLEKKERKKKEESRSGRGKKEGSISKWCSIKMC